MPTLNLAITNTDDDVKEAPAGTLQSDSTQLEVGKIILGGGDPDIDFTTGLRFRNVTLNQGAGIVSAVLEIEVIFANSPTIETDWYGVDEDNAAVWAEPSPTPSGAVKTTASAEFDVATTGRKQIDVTTIIQEIVDRPGWQSGNALALVCEYAGVTARSWIADSLDAGLATEPTLDIEYAPAVDLAGTKGAPSGRLYASELPVRGTQGTPYGGIAAIGRGNVLTLHPTHVRFFASTNVDYLTARAGSNITETISENAYVGQGIGLDGGGNPGYFCYQPQFRLASGALPEGDIYIANFTPDGFINYSGDPDTLELRVGSIGAFIPGADIASTTLIATAPISGTDPNTWTVDLPALRSVWNPGHLECIIVSRRFRQGVAPTKDDSWVYVHSSNFPIDLELTYTDALVEGTKGTPSGTLTILQSKTLRGSQGRPSGSVENTNRVTLTGTKGPPLGNVTLASQRKTPLPAGRARLNALPKGRTRIRRNGSL